MKETNAIIERVRRINNQYQHIELAIDEAMGRIKPGQSLLVRENDKSWDPYIRERWWPVGLSSGKLVIERPAEVDYQPGQLVNTIGLIGQPYRFRRTLRNVLLIAYDVPPTSLLLTIPWLLGNKISVTLVLAASARDYDTRHIAREVEITRSEETDSGFAWPDQVMTLGWADQVFVAVNPAQESAQFSEVVARFRELRTDIAENYLFGIFQQAAPCGVGACHACTIAMRNGTQLACTDGPALDLTQVVL
ncbi:MAG: hypothetical protein OHK0046_20120 [Anaerolineae bacterium]